MSPLRSSWLGRAGVALVLGGVVLLGWRMWRPAVTPVATAAAADVPAVATVAAHAASAALELPLAGADELLAEVDRRDWLVRRWREQPAVVVIQFPSLLAQGQALNRAAALLEKGRGSRERVLHDAQLRALEAASGDNMASFFLGHDYRAEGLARFFSLAQAQSVELNGGEQRLLDLLLRIGLITARPGASAGYAGDADAALVSFSAPQGDDPYTPPDESMDAVRRASVLHHELSHGRFFADAAYREHCWRFWRERLTEAQRETWRRYLDATGYDRGNEELMVNEAQALLMHTPDTRDFNAASLGIAPQDLAAQAARFSPQR
ncbi:hypothetical protein ACG02S_07165 [Roseateles sp. DC23W]|uniref:DUF1570 domain-containing protein n=1 Tax=Pelomonas dachongensis TaxID=3299029 RepID=A0ABW7ELZ6_9BURK